MTRGRSTSRKRSARGRSQTGRILRQPGRYYLKGFCTRSPCEYWHPPECQFYKTESGCKSGDKCLFPPHKVDEQPNKKPKKGYYSHKRRESGDKNAVAVVNFFLRWVVSRELLDSQRGKQARRNPMQKVLGPIRRITIHSVYATSSKNPGKERTIVWKNTCQKSSSAKSLRFEI